MKIKNLTLKEFETHKDAVSSDNILKNVVGVNSFCGNKFNINTVTYIQVRTIEKLLTKGTSFGHICEAFIKAFNVTSEQFWSSRIHEYYEARNFLIEEIKRLRENESKLLKSINIHSDLWTEAGGNRMSKFGNMMPLVKIGKIYGCYPYELQKRPYMEIITLLVLHKEEDEITSKYNELVKNRINKK